MCQEEFWFQFHKVRDMKNLHKVVYKFYDVRSGHIPVESLMNILIDCCLTLNQKKSILKLHVFGKNNFIWWNQRQQNARRLETTSFMTSKRTAFRMLCQESLFFFTSPQLDKTVTFKKL